jgi:transcriptional antiterminator NusG
VRWQRGGRLEWLVRRRTKRGRALPTAETIHAPASPVLLDDAHAPGPRPDGGWHALWTRSHCERLVHDQLAAKGFHPFLPSIASWSATGGRQHMIRVPMFAGYLFLADRLDRYGYISVRKARGLVGILGQRWDQLAIVPEPEIAAIQKLQAEDVEVAPHPYLRQGRRVRVIRGALAGVEGILEEVKASKGKLVISIDLLQRSVAAEIDCSAVVAA